MKMICKDCGKPIVKIRDLTEDELKNLSYVNAKENSLWQVANTIILNPIDRKIKRAYTRIFKLLAKVKLERVQLNRDILENNSENFIMDGSVYQHEKV